MRMTKEEHTGRGYDQEFDIIAYWDSELGEGTAEIVSSRKTRDTYYGLEEFPSQGDIGEGFRSIDHEENAKAEEASGAPARWEAEHGD